mmetsp:Transcript_16690/g.28285  ORF Transcript_16690/g.28285 Transcript_16690/m.28285 type:complete len:346 (+) Transcript_16690:103-1140(+)|eukprot:CAMPEP_0174980136 /NCGR_PEP_ID=MMETSP0004_2-20121128/15187_1 /TAXON_ID=420556 /ORGANISM="Ochromonas sp., Strain CCMP1393" /LENGTH=345 /DNA_ID=CAMNT_0016231777 /DNA_START=52 /DNA_END=1089 /DNA_ORIENTATION=+
MTTEATFTRSKTLPIQMNKKSDLSISLALRSLLSGAGAGVVCTLICAPLDVTKVRMQVQGSLDMNKYSGGVFSSMRSIYTEEGVRGIFKGVGPALITVPLFWGVYWPIYNNIKTHFAEERSDVPIHIGHLISAVTAGGVADVITNPFWVTRTRIQTLAMHPDSLIPSNVSTFQMMQLIYRNEGFMAFYKGLSASFLGLSHVAIQFPLYEYLKTMARQRHGDPNQQENFWELLAASTTAKLVASSITYPHEVLRVRLQDAGIRNMRGTTGSTSNNTRSSTTGTTPAGRSLVRRDGLVAEFLRIVRKEGVLSLWSGLSVNIFRIVPATASTFLAYEYISRFLKQQSM